MNNIKKVLSVWILATCVLPVAAQYPVIPDSVKARAAKQEAEFDRKSDAAWKKALPVVMEEAQKGRPYKPWASKPEDLVKSNIPAFPGAEGGGMYTTGGRGGRVLYVTRLDDDDQEGSLRWAVTRKYPRTILFRVSGVIRLQKRLNITGNDVTIAGQSAPGDGICIAGFGVAVRADNVILRYLRFRMGDEMGVAAHDEDALGGRYHRNILIDHCSISWSTDECASFYANENFTMQWCILSESLRRSLHAKGSHGYGGIWGGKNASFHHNLLASHDSRNPRFDHPLLYLPNVALDDFRGVVDFRNNVVYNWGSNNTYGGEGGRFNMVGNYYKPGPATPAKGPAAFITAYGRTPDLHNKEGQVYYESAYPTLYMSGNVMEGNREITRSNYDGVRYAKTGGEKGALLDEPMPVNGLGEGHTTTHDAQRAYTLVLAWAGASHVRDAVDERIVRDVRTGTAAVTDGGNGSTGGFVDTQRAVGGWPEYRQSSVPEDSDGDGIPDAWEQQHGLDPADPADAAKIDSESGYTWLECYLNSLVETITNAQNNQAKL